MATPSVKRYILQNENWLSTGIKYTKDDDKIICTEEALQEFIDTSGGKIEIENLIKNGLIVEILESSNLKSNSKK